MHVALIMAGGSGTRMSFDKPKQFCEFQGKPLIAYCLETFQKCAAVDEFLIVCKSGFEDEMQKIIRDFGICKKVNITCGGETYQESLTNGLEYLVDHGYSGTDIVSIHNANRPMVTDEIISDSICTCQQKGSGVSSIRGVDTVAYSEDGEKSSQYLERDCVFSTQSPQSYFLKDIYDVCERAKKDGIVNQYETFLMIHYGYGIYFSKGNKNNIKITHDEDVRLFLAYLQLENRN